jgi:phosphatidate cytidylyltransferase
VFAALVAFAATVMVFEWTRMATGKDFTNAFAGLAATCAAALALAAAGNFGAALATALAGGLACAFVGRADAREPRWIAVGALYIVAPSIGLIWLRESVHDGRALTLMLFLIVWAADSGGYFAGKLLGGPRMSPAISPAKTWAGAAGGLLLGALAGFLGAQAIWGSQSAPAFAAVGACLGVASILGDMAESAVKRRFGVKDSSGFIPGHGGALDRLDGMIFATTVMCLVLYGHRIAGGFPGQAP